MSNFVSIDDNNNALSTTGSPDTNDLAFVGLKSIVLGNTVSVGNTSTNVTVNTTSVSVSNATVNFRITAPTVAQVADGNYFLSANNKWVLVSGAGGAGNVSSITVANGLYTNAVGPITNTGSISVLANTGIISNTSGVFLDTSVAISSAQLSGNLANYQTTAGLSGNVALLTANNTSFVGTVTAANVVSNNQLVSNLANYVTTTALTSTLAGYVTTTTLSTTLSGYVTSSTLSSYQTTAGLSTNVATLAANSAAYLGSVAAASYVQNTDSRTLSGNLTFTGLHTISYTGSANSSIIVSGTNTKGGTGYHDFLMATNGGAGVTNPSKWFRINSTGGLEIINSAYTSTPLTLSDVGDLTITGKVATTGVNINNKQAVNGPAFSAYASAVTTIPTDVLTKVNFATEEYDTNGNFASSRFTPTVEGYYQLNSTVRISGASGTGEMMIVLYKNGAEYHRGWNSQGVQIGSGWWSMSVSSTAYANGSGDYFEIYVQQGSAANRDTTSGSTITWFNGCMIRGA